MEKWKSKLIEGLFNDKQCFSVAKQIIKILNQINPFSLLHFDSEFGKSGLPPLPKAGYYGTL